MSWIYKMVNGAIYGVNCSLLPAEPVYNTIMSDMVSQGGQAETNVEGRWRRRTIPILALLLVIAITVVLFLYRDKVADLGNYGYLGVFLISLICSATIILPMPGMLLIFAFGAAFNPILVGLIAALGGTIGEITGYVLGYSGRRILKGDKIFNTAEKWVRKWGTMTIFIFALVPPLSIDIVGIVAGSMRFPLWKFFLACFLGKALLYTGMAYAGAWGWESVLRYFS